MVNATILIINNEIRVKSMTASDKDVIEDYKQLMHLKTILDDTLFNFEKNHQKQFIPTKDTVYNIPKDV